MTTPAVLGERVLRRLGVAVVPVASRPMLAAVVSVTSIAERALQALGVTVTAANRPALTTVVTMQAIADAALQAVGVTVPVAHQPPAAGTPASTTDIAGSALIELGVVASDETPSASDLTVALEKAVDVHGALVGQGIASWTGTTIPVALIEEYTKLTALLLASSFGKTGDPALWAPLEARVRKYSQVHESQGAVILARVASVHDSLVADASASWASTAIPQAVFDEYVQLTWAQIAPVFAMTVDPAIVPALAARVKRVALLLQAQALAEARVATVHDELVGNAHVSWALNAIPQAVADDYVALVQFQMSNAFGMHTDVPNLVQTLEARIRHFSLVQRAPDLATEAVMAVHADLGARGKLRWTIFDLPQEAEQPYVLLAAFRLGPEFDRQVAPTDVVMAEKALARMIALPTSGQRVRAEYLLGYSRAMNKRSAEYRAKRTKQKNLWLAAKSPEERAIHNKERLEWRARWLASRTPEQLAEWRAKQTARAKVWRYANPEKAKRPPKKRKRGFFAYAVLRIETGKLCYIGATTVEVRHRWAEHIRPSSRDCATLRAAIDRHGHYAFEAVHIASAWDAKSLYDLEVILIAQYNTMEPLGYNSTTGGKVAFKMSNATRERMSASKKGIAPLAAIEAWRRMARPGKESL